MRHRTYVYSSALRIAGTPLQSIMTITSKNQEKKLLKKQIRAQHAITADTRIECSNQPTEFLVVCNAGLATGLRQTDLLQAAAAAAHGAVRTCIMLPNKSYCFLHCCTPADAARIHDALHGRTELAQNSGVLYLSYCAGVPAVQSTWSGDLPAGLHVIEQFISVDEERELLATFRAGDDDATTHLKHRHVQHFGYEFRYGSNDVDHAAPLLDRPIPPRCQSLWPRLAATASATTSAEIATFRPDQLTVNTYAPGHGIPPHCDTHSPFVGPIASLSLGAGVVMDFRRPADGRQRSVWLPARSLLVMAAEARLGWTHAIAPRTMDVVEQTMTDGGAGGGLTVRPRVGQRVSLTFRQLRRPAGAACSCAYPALCDSQQQPARPDAQSDADDAQLAAGAAQLELNNVHRVYDTIAGHFSETRHSPWPQVLDFVRSVRRDGGALLVDVGCGNGKYLVADDASADDGMLMLGGDRSAGLLGVCRERRLQVLRCDCLYVPLRDRCADAVICIAVVHHLATAERRLRAMAEMARVLRVGGRALVYVWAKNQALDRRQSSYLRQNRRNNVAVRATPDGEAATQPPAAEAVVEYVDGLPVHTNRTQFAAQDMLVPWKLKPSGGGSGEEAQQFLRFYHVFEEGELEALVRRVDGVSVVRSYYDQGNWCVVFERTDEQKVDS